RSWAQLSILAAVGATAFASSGCEPPARQETKGITTAKLLVPDPTMTAKASSTTRSMLGIDEWRLYRGRGGVYLTGYDAGGKAVKGLVTVFARNDDGSIANIYTRVNDGSKFVVGHSLGSHRTAATKGIAEDSQAFVRRAALDLAVLHRVAQAQAR